MGRPKGSKNKSTLEKEAKRGPGRPKKVLAAPARRGRPPKVEPKKRGRPAKTETKTRKPRQPKTVIEDQNPRIVALFDQVREMQGQITSLATRLDLSLSVGRTLIEIARANFFDGWKQYSETLTRNDKTPEVKDYIHLFSYSAAVLGIKGEDLPRYGDNEEEVDAGTMESSATVAAPEGITVPDVEPEVQYSADPVEQTYPEPELNSLNVL